MSSNFFKTQIIGQTFSKTPTGDRKSESESLTLRQCNAFTEDVPSFGQFIEQLQIFLVTIANFGVSIIFYTLSKNSSIFTLYFPA